LALLISIRQDPSIRISIYRRRLLQGEITARFASALKREVAIFAHAECTG